MKKEELKEQLKMIFLVCYGIAHVNNEICKFFRKGGRGKK